MFEITYNKQILENVSIKISHMIFHALTVAQSLSKCLKTRHSGFMFKQLVNGDSVNTKICALYSCMFVMIPIKIALKSPLILREF